MPGSLDLFDSQWLTANSESSPRTMNIDTLQVHHTAYPSLSGSRALMDPGGRTVSANGLLGQDGTLYEVAILSRRAFTSASAFDNRSLTVETVNTTGGPGWGIDPRSRERLAQLAVAMKRAGILSGYHRGPGGIIGHNEVPGSYATACPGPDMYLDAIAARAAEIDAGGDASGEGEDDMQHIWTKDPAAGSKNARYAIIDLGLDDGVWVTETKADADLMSWLAWNKVAQGAPLEVNGYLFDQKVNAARRARLMTGKPTGGITDAQVTAIATAIAASLSSSGVASKTDVENAKKAIIAAIPTTFVAGK